MQRALLLLSYRPRSEAEIRQKLAKAGFEPEVIATVLERLRANGLVRDEGFAHEWVENRGAFRPRSRRMLAYELRRKGVAEETIQQALATLLRGRTSFVIAHRLSTVVNADRILVVQDGRVVEEGTHQELLARGGTYYQLYRTGFEQ